MIMNKLVTDNFIKSLPIGKKDVILEKIDKFFHELKQNNNEIKNISNSFSVRKIRGNTDLYKFRVDKSNRVVFTFASKIKEIREEFKNNKYIILLDYCNHDNQITRARNLGLNVRLSSLDEEIVFDEIIDENYKTYQYNPEEIITRVVDNQSLVELLKEDEKNAIYYLNEEQNECLRSDLTPLFLFGSAGSGKTTVGINKIYSLYKHNNIEIGYFTYSSLLKNDTKNMFNYLLDKKGKSLYDSKVDFQEVNKYLKNKSNKSSFVKFEEFRNWFEKNISRSNNYSKFKFEAIDVWKEIRGIIKGMIGIDWTADIKISEQKLLNKGIYFSMSKEYSIYDTEERILIYEIAHKYQDFLESENKFDENDIARLVIGKLESNKLKKYDFVLVDEIQDLTEKQIYLIYHLVKNSKNVLFSGDFNQTINPTYFNTTRIESLLKIYNPQDNFNKRILNTNYRSSREIVELSNKIADLRIDKLYKNKRNDYIERPIRDNTIKPFLLKGDIDDKIKLLNTVKDRHYVAIVVCDEEDKYRLKYDLGIEESVFTVSEIKGIEKNYIICYNIISKYYKVWEKILEGIDYDNHSLYRYYFNMFYVSITRARDYITFYEDRDVENFYNNIKDYIQVVDHFDEDTMMFNYISSEDDYYNEGLYLESRGKYEQAIMQYKRSSHKKVDICINRCRALIIKEEGKYFEAGGKLLKLKEYNLASECYREAQSYNNLLKCLILDNRSYKEIIEEFENIEVRPIELIINEKYKSNWVDKFYYLYEGYLTEKINKNNENIELIKTIVETIQNK